METTISLLKKNTKNILIILVLLFFIFLSSVFLNTEKNQNPSYIKSVKIGDQVLNVDLALTEEQHGRGLSGRNNLEENKGMLFVFENSGIYSFWMKNMNFPIDIIWINEDMKIVFIERNADPSSFPKSFSPKENSKYVLEVVSNFSNKNNVKEGDTVRFIY